MDGGPVTIDGHAVNIWRGRAEPLKTVVQNGGFKYEIVADDYRHVARAAGILPNQLQAITWFAWKRINNIIFAGRQLKLFEDNSADLWETLRSPESIDVFPPFDEPRFSTLQKGKTKI